MSAMDVGAPDPAALLQRLRRHYVLGRHSEGWQEWVHHFPRVFSFDAAFLADCWTVAIQMSPASSVMPASASLLSTFGGASSVPSRAMSACAVALCRHGHAREARSMLEEWLCGSLEEFDAASAAYVQLVHVYAAVVLVQLKEFNYATDFLVANDHVTDAQRRVRPI